jgi:hypothetical protein
MTILTCLFKRLMPSYTCQQLNRFQAFIAIYIGGESGNLERAGGWFPKNPGVV